MKILKFNESSEDILKIIKEYFYNITEDLNDICRVDFSKINENVYEVLFKIEYSNYKNINQLIDIHEKSIKVLKEVNFSVSNLVNESIIEDFKIEQQKNNYLKLTLNKSESDKWFHIIDWEIYFDEFIFKKTVKEKFNITVDNARINTYYDNNPVIKIVTLESEIDDFVNYLKTYKIESPYKNGGEDLIFETVYKVGKTITCRIRYSFDLL